MWYKEGNPVIKVFDSSSPNTGLLKGQIFGTPTQKNCTTRFDNVSQSHNGSYYFRLEANGILKYNYIAPIVLYSQVQIAILGAPPKPTVSIFKNQQQVIEGISVSLRCSTKIFCPLRPPSLTWGSSLNENVTGRQYQTQTELISDLNFTVSHRHHRVTFTCTATHQLQQQTTTQESRMLQVQYAPKNTSVRLNPAGLVLEGGSVTLSCSSDANPAVNYTWYRDTEGPLNPVQTGPNLTINNTNSTHSGRYYCTAENKHGTQNTSVLLDVQFAPKISSSCSRITVIACVCEAHGNPSPTLEWRLSGHTLANSTETSISEKMIGSTGVKSILTTHQSLTDVLQCFSANIYGSASQKFQAVPRYKKQAIASDNYGKCVYTNKGMLSSTVPSAPESLHYSTINFTNTEPPSGEICGITSLTSEYATIQHRPAGAATSETEPKKQDRTAKITDKSSLASEVMIYENISHRYRQKELLVSAEAAEMQE
ncbi:hypothetical protein Q8A67_013097 [Cirrhinus molitorella]|uniref:Ig-like domain-containing protein n=1 Tax=Cirrhinus molitorella TaxID=172907 RepID=A0AA88PNE2_9TELE|nr:hypothetical protein Q8A67_013097 [Cirrhinus molitorella]